MTHRPRIAYRRPARPSSQHQGSRQPGPLVHRTQGSGEQAVNPTQGSPEHGIQRRQGSHAPPDDPPWRSRTPHRHLDRHLADALRVARQAHGWSFDEAADRTGVTSRYLRYLEQGQRVPSVDVAVTLAAVYRLPAAVADHLQAAALPRVGRDSPYRRGWRPGEDPDAV